MKRILVFLLMLPLAFAAWQELALAAITTSAILLASIYMVAIGFGVNELKIMAKEEFFQLIAAVILVVLLVGTDSVLNEISKSEIFLEPGTTTLQGTANAILSRWSVDMNAIFMNIRNNDLAASREGSKGSQCSIVGMGFSVSACGGYSMLATPFSMAGGIAGFAIGELSAIKKLIDISDKFALSLLLPFGIILRTLKFTRGAGGLIIALGISLHILLPGGIVFADMLGQTFIESDKTTEYRYENFHDIVFSCNPGDTKPALIEFDNINIPSDVNTISKSRITGAPLTDNERNSIEGYAALRGNLRKYLFVILIQATMGPVIALLLVASGIKAISSLAGSEVDVSAISRFV